MITIAVLIGIFAFILLGVALFVIFGGVTGIAVLADIVVGVCALGLFIKLLCSRFI